MERGPHPVAAQEGRSSRDPRAGLASHLWCLFLGGGGERSPGSRLNKQWWRPPAPSWLLFGPEAPQDGALWGLPCPGPVFGSAAVMLVPGLGRGEEEKLLTPRAGDSGCLPPLVTAPELLGAALCGLTKRGLSCRPGPCCIPGWQGDISCRILLLPMGISPAGYRAACREVQEGATALQ